jgi:hypothetical protein
MHRYTPEGVKRQPPELLHYASLQEGFDAAIQHIRAAADDVIESWRQQKDN